MDQSSCSLRDKCNGKSISLRADSTQPTARVYCAAGISGCAGNLDDFPARKRDYQDAMQLKKLKFLLSRGRTKVVKLICRTQCFVFQDLHHHHLLFLLLVFLFFLFFFLSFSSRLSILLKCKIFYKIWGARFQRACYLSLFGLGCWYLKVDTFIFPGTVTR